MSSHSIEAELILWFQGKQTPAAAYQNTFMFFPCLLCLDEARVLGVPINDATVKDKLITRIKNI